VGAGSPDIDTPAPVAPKSPVEQPQQQAEAAEEAQQQHGSLLPDEPADFEAPLRTPPLVQQAQARLGRLIEPWDADLWSRAYQEVAATGQPLRSVACSRAETPLLGMSACPPGVSASEVSPQAGAASGRSATSTSSLAAARRQLIKLVETSTSEAIAAGGYDVVGSPTAARPQRVEFSTSRGLTPSIRWHGMDTLRVEIEAIEGACEEHAHSLQALQGKASKPVVACKYNPIDMAVRLSQRAEQEGLDSRSILTAEVLEFDDVGCIGLKSSAIAPDLLLRSNLASFVDAARREMKASSLSMREHMRATGDPYILLCRDVQVFRSSLDEGFKFYDEPVFIHVFLYALAQHKPAVQTFAGAHGQSIWYLNQHNHLELLERLHLLGLASHLWVLGDGAQHNIVFGLPGGPQPLDALVNSLKHWWKLFHCQYRSAWFCAYEGANIINSQRTLSRLDMALNSHLYKAEGAVSNQVRLDWQGAILEAAALLHDLQQLGKRRNRCTRRFTHLLQRLSKRPDTNAGGAYVFQAIRRKSLRGLTQSNLGTAPMSLVRKAAIELMKSHRTSLLTKDFRAVAGEDSASTASLAGSCDSRDASPDDDSKRPASGSRKLSAAALMELQQQGAFDRQRAVPLRVVEDGCGEMAVIDMREDGAASPRSLAKRGDESPTARDDLSPPRSGDDPRRKAEKRWNLAMTHDILRFWSPPASRQNSKKSRRPETPQQQQQQQQQQPPQPVAETVEEASGAEEAAEAETVEKEASAAPPEEQSSFGGGSAAERRFTVPPSFRGQEKLVKESDASRRRSLQDEASKASHHASHHRASTSSASWEWLQTRVTKVRKQHEADRGLKNAEVRRNFTTDGMADFGVLAVGRRHARESITSITSEGIRGEARRTLRSPMKRHSGAYRSGRYMVDIDADKISSLVARHRPMGSARRESIKAMDKAALGDNLHQQVMEEAAVIEQMLQEARKARPRSQRAHQELP